MPLNRSAIVDTAIELIEREGADAVSMRRLAAELEVGVMSLYNHLPSKAALLDGVAERVLSRIEFRDDPGAPWSDRVRMQAHAFRQLARDYPRSTMVVVSRQLNSAAGLLPVERALATLRSAGLDGPDAVRMLRIFIAYVVGSLLREVGVTPAFAPVRDAPEGVAELDPGLFPQVVELAPLFDSGDHAAEFAFGVELLIQAIAVYPGRKEAQ